MGDQILNEFTWTEHEQPHDSRSGQLARGFRTLSTMVVAAVVMGLLAAMLALPPLLGAGAGARAGARYAASLPATIVEPPLPQRSVMLDARGKPFATFYSYNRAPVAFDRISPWMRKAVVATEDARFYTHDGYDLRGIARAAASNQASDGGGLQGASTITQQYIKNVLVLSAELGSQDEAAREGKSVSLTRKLRELKLAARLDSTLTKDEILTKYLNIAYFGSGAYGVEAAARRYFSVPAAALTATQAATLTSLLKNPTAYDPLRYPDVALERRAIVLDRMVKEGHLDATEADELKTTKLGLKPSTPKHGCAASRFPFYCAKVISLLTNDEAFGKTAEDRARLLAVGGLRIQTPLMPAASDATTAAARSTIPADHPVATAATVVRPGTGEVVAIGTNRFFGGNGPSQTELPLATTPAFQPGSTFKMFTLAAVLEAGYPASHRVPGGASYTSRVFNNPSKGYFSNSAGSVSNPDLAKSAQLSMNTAFVQLQELVGTRAVADVAARLGVAGVRPGGLSYPAKTDGSFTLGVANTSVVEIANAYATIAAHGKYCPPVFISAVTDADGNRLATPDSTCRQVLDPAVADTVAAILGTVISEGTGKPMAFGRPAAGKTGTTENLGAAWFAGFTPQYATAVWVGDPRGGAAHPLVNVLGYAKVFGSTLPGQVWRKTMVAVHRGVPVQQLPVPNGAYVTTASGARLPSVAGLSVDEARARLSQAGASAKLVRYRPPAPGQAAGVVVDQEPQAGSRAVGAVVTLTVTR